MRRIARASGTCSAHGALALLALGSWLLGCAGCPAAFSSPAGGPDGTAPRGGEPPAELVRPGERHLRNLRQLTFGGENAEAYFSFDGTRLVFQSTRPPFACDQIFVMGLEGGTPRLVSTGKGRTTCAYFLPDGQRVLYASTHLDSPDCPPPPDRSRGYVWPVYSGYDLFIATADQPAAVRLTDTPGYDAEATVSPRGDRIVFTSMRDGDLELYSMRLDGSELRRLTHEVGYDGGAFYSPDGSRIVYRRSRFDSEAEVAEYRELLAQGKVRPGKLEIWVMDADGSNKRQVTDFGAASFCPFFHPDGERIIFSSNLHEPRSRNFELYLIRVDGTGLERVTFSEEFDGFPMFSPDGTRLVFCSNRNAARPGETNVFVADWVE
ncbi:MAG: hypothetical protein KatS3mg102_2387 [Planctomycetota bacterium]|nr:MAG: hypothetical protein KatS3mg102_2387 [Planctomycetota bacterium]